MTTLNELTSFVFESDMFPGIDSSAFDEHDKQKSCSSSAKEEIDKVRQQRELLTSLVDKTFEDVTEISNFLKKHDSYNFLGSNSGHYVKYANMSGLEAKLPDAYLELSTYNVYYNPNAPLSKENKLMKHLVRYDRALNRMSVYDKKQFDLGIRITQLKKELCRR